MKSVSEKRGGSGNELEYEVLKVHTSFAFLLVEFDGSAGLDGDKTRQSIDRMKFE